MQDCKLIIKCLIYAYPVVTLSLRDSLNCYTFSDVSSFMLCHYFMLCFSLSFWHIAFMCFSFIAEKSKSCLNFSLRVSPQFFFILPETSVIHIALYLHRLSAIKHAYAEWLVFGISEPLYSQNRGMGQQASNPMEMRGHLVWCASGNQSIQTAILWHKIRSPSSIVSNRTFIYSGNMGTAVNTRGALINYRPIIGIGRSFGADKSREAFSAELCNHGLSYNVCSVIKVPQYIRFCAKCYPIGWFWIQRISDI